jgi:hypothetical protein
MNLSTTVNRTHKMLRSIPRPTENERQVFSFLLKHAGIINELEILFDQLDKISERLKNEGLSHKIADELLEEINILQASSRKRPARVFASCTEYLKELRAKLPD